MTDRSLASERNPFPQDIERLSFTSPRRSWFSKNLSSLVYTAISLIVFAYNYFTFYPLVGNYGFNDSNSTTVMSQNYTPKSVTFPASTSTVSPSIPYESSIPNATSWTNANEVPWITTVPSTIPTTAAIAEPTTIPTSVSTAGLATTVTSSTILEVKNLTITVTSVVTTQETAFKPRRFGHRDENSYVAEDDEYDRPQFMGKVPWDWCVPRWQPLDEFVDKQWMCNRCHSDALAGIYKIEELYIRDYEYWCFQMCFINSHFEECAVHLNRTQPRPSPDTTRDCRFCEEQERHRKPSRLFV